MSEQDLPPRIDASPEEIAATALRTPPLINLGRRRRGPGRTYRCSEREVKYPEILYRDGLCEACHSGARAPG